MIGRAGVREGGAGIYNFRLDRVKDAGKPSSIPSEVLRPIHKNNIRRNLTTESRKGETLLEGLVGLYYILLT